MIQCHHPEGSPCSSGSNNVTTKLFVPAGAPVHCSGGDIFPPVHPYRLRVYISGTFIANCLSGLKRTNFDLGTDFSCATKATASSDITKATTIRVRVMSAFL